MMSLGSEPWCQASTSCLRQGFTDVDGRDKARARRGCAAKSCKRARTRSPGARRNPGPHIRDVRIPDCAPLHPGYESLLASPTRRKLLQPAQHESRAPFRVIEVVGLEVRQAAQQGGDGDFGFDAGKLGAQAEMDAAAER